MRRSAASVWFDVVAERPENRGSMIPDLRLFPPSAASNHEAILHVLRRHLPARGTVLEVANGSGEHCVFFAAAYPALTIQPSDPDPAARGSIDALGRTLALGNVRPAVVLAAASDTWPVTAADAVLCSNMIHIAPWRAAEGLVRSAARTLPPGPPVVLLRPLPPRGPPRRGRQCCF